MCIGNVVYDGTAAQKCCQAIASMYNYSKCVLDMYGRYVYNKHVLAW